MTAVFDSLSLSTKNFLSGLHIDLVPGAANDANIAIGGILTTDKILLVKRLDRDAVAANITMDNLTTEASITTDGNLQLSDTSTVGDVLEVWWYDLTV